MPFTLPPVNQIPGFNTGGQPTMNPASARQPFFQAPDGSPISVTNAGEAVYVPQQGYNPLYYGQTAAYTGPTGSSDRGNNLIPLPRVDEIVADDGPKEGVSMADMMGLQNMMMYGDGGYSRPIFGNMGVPNIFEIFEQAPDGSYVLPDKSTGAYGSEYFYNKAGTPLHKQSMDDGSTFGYDRALRIGGMRLNQIDELE